MERWLAAQMLKHDRLLHVSAQGYDAIDPEHVNINTWQKISSDLRTFYDWLRLNNEYRNVEDIPPPELDELLSKMFSGNVFIKILFVKKLLLDVIFVTVLFD